nr:hypothetical protein GCM10020092_018150 [Actinoplanes digitatis]
MSYLEPRGGQHPSGGRAPGQSGAPAPYVSGVPAEEPDPYAAYRRREEAQRATETGPNWDAFAPGPPQPSGPPWAAPTAATSTSQAEWELTEAERPPRAGLGAGPGATASHRPAARAATCPPRSGSAPAWS